LGVALSAAVPESVYQDAFVSWMQTYGESYAPEEFFYRYDTFKSNYDFVEKHNSGNYTWTVELNKFADLSSGEFKNIYLGFKPELARSSRHLSLADLKVGAYPSGSLDWVAKGAVTGIKDQGQCGSCWAFSSTGSTEGAVFLKYGHLTSLSEQELVDCAGTYGNQGCNGGLMDNTFKYIEANGLCTESAYHTLARMVLARNPPALSPLTPSSLVTRMLPTTRILLAPLLILPPSQLPLKLIKVDSNFTSLVSSAVSVAKTWTMEFLL